ncbi:response regulator transcription factor [Mitsuaria sp. GD03876]|uniref:response regulator n=1 Tax=Mitsuaria sp. GD03876 TaxID=2975399 RepID=UPI0024497040|nr:response regulator transcription factor [Mitsuaria sp. GD03876]MDH0863430.1 response regulator transcription factor [Mitsuaria sp. GD03876]
MVLVEDSLTIRRQLLHRLDAVPGLRVVGEAADEATALALIGHLRPSAVLLDLSLAQGGSGIAVLKALRRQGYAGQVHVLSHQTEAYRAAVLAAGANGFFDKAEELDAMLVQLTGQPEVPAPRPLDAAALRERLDQTVKLAMRDGAEVVVHVVAGRAESLPPLAAQLIVGLDGGDLVGWSDATPGDRLCVVQVDSDDAPSLRERLDVLAPDVRLGRARLPDDALSAGGLIALAELRALGLLPG